MKKLFYFLLATTGITSLLSCEEDFKITAPYKETTVIYSLLNPNDSSAQYIRINKTFLGEGDITLMAKQSDSINFKPTDLEVSLEHYQNGNLVGPLSLKDTFITKEPGDFSDQQLLYVTHDIIEQDQPGIGITNTYRLTVKNKKNGVISTAETKIVSKMNLNIPNNQANFVQDNNLVTTKTTCPIKAGTNAKAYSLNIRFHFTEIYQNGDSSEKYVDFPLGEIVSKDLAPTISFTTQSFFSNIEAQVKPDLNVKSRKIDNYLIYELTGVTEDFYNYVQINKPSSGIVQEKPEFTNIKNGIGYFSCRPLLKKKIQLTAFTIAYIENLQSGNLSFKF